ncbi:MAG: tetratricopeptide repeat protein [Microscillaceae bacterium]|nr:tetratricopeptide repeat protein [Microscillaceae bacterium]
MNKTKLIQLIENPSQITENDLEHLEEIIATYPYCQVAHLMIAKFTHDQESMLAPQKIRRAAAYAYDRTLLRQLILGKSSKLSQNNSIQLKTQVDQLDQQGEKVNHPLSENTPLIQEKTDTSQETPTSNKSFFDTITLDKSEPDFPQVESEPEFAPFSGFTEENISPKSESNNLLNEGMALTLYHEGKEEEAIRVYQQLAKLHPERKQYFYNQISILQGSDFVSDEQEVKKSTPDQKWENHTASFFENLDIPDTESQEILPIAESLPSSVYEDINEGKAMGLYYDGKTEEAQAMYLQLMELYPDKKAHYQEQLNDLIGIKPKTSYNESDNTQNLSKTIIPADEKSFFEGINTLEDASSLPPDNTQNHAEVFPEKDNSSAKGSFFDMIESEFKNNPITNFPTPDLIQDDTSDAVPDVSSLEPVGLDNKEETDYINESEAIMLFNQGKNAEAIRIYESLIVKNPQKASYYRSQINVLRETELGLNPENALSKKTEDSLQNQSGSFTPIDLDAYTEEISERAAIQLFNLGNTGEAIAVYEKLILKFPEKKSYFLSQIEILRS